MQRTSHRTLAGVVAVAFALLISACGASGGNDADKDEKTTTTAAEKETTTTEAPTTTAPDDEDDDEDGGDAEAQARADSVDLTVEDFGEGWELIPAEEDEGPSGIEQCDETSAADEALATHTSGDFSIGDFNTDDGVQVRIKTKVFPDEDTASAALDVFADDVVIACVDDLFKAQFTGAGTIEGDMTPQDYGDTTADEAVAVAGEYTVTTPDGTEVPLVVAVAVLRTGDVATQIQVTGVGPMIGETDLDGMIAKVEELQAAA